MAVAVSYAEDADTPEPGWCPGPEFVSECGTVAMVTWGCVWWAESCESAVEEMEELELERLWREWPEPRAGGLGW